MDSRNFDVCEMSGDYETDSEEMEANARLIAAAPDLLALAKQYASECSECGGTGKCLDDSACEDCADIRQVINKAEGRV